MLQHGALVAMVRDPGNGYCNTSSSTNPPKKVLQNSSPKKFSKAREQGTK
jgi:hypothetical protein